MSFRYSIGLPAFPENPLEVGIGVRMIVLDQRGDPFDECLVSSCGFSVIQ